MQISVQSGKQNLGIEPAPHLHCAMSTQKIMVLVLLSLIPAVGVFTYFFGAGTLVQFVLAAVTAIICQLLAARLRGRPLKRALRDPSGLVTALLLALTLPPLMPWYFTVVGTIFAMIIVRECFGGLGMNLFNPAMSGFIFLVVSVPGVFYNTWITPTPNALSVASPTRVYEVVFEGASPDDLIAELKVLNRAQEEQYYLEQAIEEAQKAAKEAAQKAAAEAALLAQTTGQINADGTTTEEAAPQETVTPATEFAAEVKAAAKAAQEAKEEVPAPQEPELDIKPYDGPVAVDVLTGATFLESIKTARKAGNVADQIKVDFFNPSFTAYMWLAAAYALGGIFLIATHVIRFQVPLSFLVGIVSLGALWHYLDPNMSISALEHVLMGGTMLGAFYIVTDPVTTCGTFKGRILLSFIIGLLVIVIRIHGSYSDSVAFAVMLGNCMAPLMDVMTKRRPFGVGYRKGGLQ